MVNNDETTRDAPGYTLGGCTGKGWVPGVSGNPSGRPKDPLSLVKILREILSEDENAKAKTLVNTLVDTAIETGDAALMKQILERIDGKVPDLVHVSRDLDEMTHDELLAERDRLRAEIDGDTDGDG